MSWLVAVLTGALGLVALDRLLRWMERRGWIFYRERKPTGSGAGNAIAEFQAMLQPEVREVVEAKAVHEAEEDDDEGGPRRGEGRRRRRS